MFRKIRNYSSVIIIAGDTWEKCHEKEHSKGDWYKAYSKCVDKPEKPANNGRNLYIEKLESIS